MRLAKRTKRQTNNVEKNCQWLHTISSSDIQSTWTVGLCAWSPVSGVCSACVLSSCPSATPRQSALPRVTSLWRNSASICCSNWTSVGTGIPYCVDPRRATCSSHHSRRSDLHVFATSLFISTFITLIRFASCKQISYAFNRWKFDRGCNESNCESSWMRQQKSRHNVRFLVLMCSRCTTSAVKCETKSEMS